MASYTIHWSCGHTSDKRLYGPTSERESYIEWASLHGICPACYRAKLLDGPMGWAIKIMMEKRPEDTRKAKYWIDRRDRPNIDWARVALPTTWDASWAPGRPELDAAVDIIQQATYDRGTNTNLLYQPLDRIVTRLAELAAVPIDDNRPALGDHGDRHAIDHWLLCQWARNGLIDWLKAQMQASIDSHVDAKAVAQQTAEAQRQQATAQKQIEEAKRITELARSSIDEAERIAGIASLIIGAVGLIDGQEFILTDVRDEGACVLVRQKDGQDILDLSAHTWCQAHMRYLAKLADHEVKL